MSHVVLPQTRAFALERGRGPIVIERIEARVEIVEQAAVTTLEISVRNPSPHPAEAVLLLPVPDGAAVHSFLIEDSSRELTARLLPRDEARRTYSYEHRWNRLIVERLLALGDEIRIGLGRESVFAGNR